MSDPYIKKLSDLLQADTTNKTRDALLIKLASDRFGENLKTTVNDLDIDISDINSEVIGYITDKVKTLETALGNPITKNEKQEATLIKLLTESATKNPNKNIASKHAHIDKIINRIKFLNHPTSDNNEYAGRSDYDGKIGKDPSETTNALEKNFSERSKITNTDPLIIDFNKTNTERPFKFLEKDGAIGDGKDRYDVSFDENGEFLYKITYFGFLPSFTGGKRKSRKYSKSSRKSRKSRR